MPHLNQFQGDSISSCKRTVLCKVKFVRLKNNIFYQYQNVENYERNSQRVLIRMTSSSDYSLSQIFTEVIWQPNKCDL